MHYDQEYFFILKPADERLPFLVPNANTQPRHFNFEVEPAGSPPLVFYNAWREQNKAEGVRSRTPGILFSGSDLVVRTQICEKLLMLSIPHLYMHPTIYIDDDDKWHEDDWYMTFTDMFDCWDRNDSDYFKQGPVRLGGFELYEVHHYRLDKDVLDKTALAQRRLFKMGSTLDGHIVCHQSVAAIFKPNGNNAIELTAIADY